MSKTPKRAAGANQGPDDGPDLVTRLIRDTRRTATRIAGDLPAVDVRRVLEMAGKPPVTDRPVTARPVTAGTLAANLSPPTSGTSRRRGAITWIPRALAAAAALAVVAGTLFIALPRSTSLDPIPPHLSQFVDSLYPTTDYIHDELAQIMWPETSGNRDGYLDDVWDAVTSDIGEP